MRRASSRSKYAMMASAQPSSDGLGHGLVGIRERVKIYGGEMTAGPAPSGGFLLSARLPIREDTP